MIGEALGSLFAIAAIVAMIFFGAPMNEADYQDCRLYHGPVTCAKMWWFH